MVLACLRHSTSFVLYFRLLGLDSRLGLSYPGPAASMFTGVIRLFCFDWAMPVCEAVAAAEEAAVAVRFASVAEVASSDAALTG